MLSSPAAIQWYDAPTLGNQLGSGSPFNPVGVLNSPLANTSTAGTTVFYAACSTAPDCRTPVNFVINNPVAPAGTFETVTTGAWTNTATWRQSDGCVWVTGAIPSGSSSVIIKHDVTLDAPATVNSLSLTTGKLSLGNNDITTATVSGSATAYVVTDGTGKLIVPAAATPTVTTYPVGSSASSYDPVTVKPTTASSFAVNVKATTVAGDFTGTISNFALVAKRQWDINPTGTPGSTEISLTNGGTPYTPATAVIGHYTGGAWTEVPATFSPETWTTTVSSFSPFGAGSAGGFVAACVPPSITSATAGTDPICSNATTTLTANGVAGTNASVTWWTQKKN